MWCALPMGLMTTFLVDDVIKRPESSSAITSTKKRSLTAIAPKRLKTLRKCQLTSIWKSWSVNSIGDVISGLRRSLADNFEVFNWINDYNIPTVAVTKCVWITYIKSVQTSSDAQITSPPYCPHWKTAFATKWGKIRPKRHWTVLRNRGCLIDWWHQLWSAIVHMITNFAFSLSMTNNKF
jgi:hypothetical protein